MENNGKKIFDDDYMNWMMLNPDLYGMERHEKRDNSVSNSGGELLLIFIIYIIIAPLIFIVKIIRGEETDTGDLALAFAGLFFIIIIAGIIIKSGKVSKTNGINNDNKDIISNSTRNKNQQKYVAKANNSFKE